MFQIVEQPQPEKMFHEQYAFYSSTSRYMQAHFERFANARRSIGALNGRSDPFVVELGSNDGIMLRHFKNAASAISASSRRSMSPTLRASGGIRTIRAFFRSRPRGRHRRRARPRRRNLGRQCDVPHSRISPAWRPACGRLLKPDGVFIFEDPYLGDMIAKTSYDQIYDEHVFIFSATSVASRFCRARPRTRRRRAADHPRRLDALHAGARRAAGQFRRASPSNSPRSRRKGSIGPRPIGNSRKIASIRAAASWRTLDTICAVQGKRVVGYGATSKSTTVTNYCGITPDHVEFISDTTPIKQGKLSPGAHIPVRPYAEFVRKAIPIAPCCLPGTTLPKSAKRNRHSLPRAGGGSSTYPK